LESLPGISRKPRGPAWFLLTGNTRSGQQGPKSQSPLRSEMAPQEKKKHLKTILQRREIGGTVVLRAHSKSSWEGEGQYGGLVSCSICDQRTKRQDGGYGRERQNKKVGLLAVHQVSPVGGSTYKKKLRGGGGWRRRVRCATLVQLIGGDSIGSDRRDRRNIRKRTK